MLPLHVLEGGMRQGTRQQLGQRLLVLQQPRRGRRLATRVSEVHGDPLRGLNLTELLYRQICLYKSRTKG
jgi:hypothetical protein